MITLTPITWTVRCGSDHDCYGDPYDGVATVQRCVDEAHVSAACGRLPIEEQIELCRELKGMGFSAIVFEHVKNGEFCLCRRKLNRKSEKSKGDLS